MQLTKHPNLKPTCPAKKLWPIIASQILLTVYSHPAISHMLLPSLACPWHLTEFKMQTCNLRNSPTPAPHTAKLANMENHPKRKQQKHNP